MNGKIYVPLAIVFVIAFLVGSTAAQPTSFTYQGNLNFNGSPANGNFTFEFALFDDPNAGNQLGSTITALSIPITNGLFTQNLDFGPQFAGGLRYLEFRVKPFGSGAFTTLLPRQQIKSSPYAIKSLDALTATNSLQLGGVAANQYVVTSDSRMSDARNPLPNSVNYIQNQNTGPQTSTNFNISGTGTTGSLNTRIVKINNQPQSCCTTALEVIGQQSEFTRYGAPHDFRGFFARGTEASPLPVLAGDTLFKISFGGYDGTDFSTLGGSRIEAVASENWTPTARGSELEFWIHRIGTGGSSVRQLLLANDHVSLRPPVGISSIVFSPEKSLHIAGTGDQEIMIQSTDAGGRKWTLQSSDGAAGGRFEIVDRTAVVSRFTILDDGSVGIGTTAPTDRLDVNGMLRVRTLATGTSTNVCRSATNQLAACTSSIKYKSNIMPFRSGIDLIKQLQPVQFNWKTDGSHDLGLVAEEVAKAEPLLSTANEKGEVEGVKYDRISVVLINAFKEQQVQIEALQKRAEQSDAVVRSLKVEIRSLKRAPAKRKHK